MRMLLAAVAVVALAMPAAAMEIEVHPVDAALMASVYNGTPDQAHYVVADTTVLLDFGGLDNETLARVPVGGNAIIYFNPDGSLVAWSNKSPTLVAGRWVIHHGVVGNSVCLTFGTESTEVCTAADLKNQYLIKQSTMGNPFKLSAGAAIPFPVPINEPKLEDIAQQVAS